MLNSVEHEKSFITSGPASELESCSRWLVDNKLPLHMGENECMKVTLIFPDATGGRLTSPLLGHFDYCLGTFHILLSIGIR